MNNLSFENMNFDLLIMALAVIVFYMYFAPIIRRKLRGHVDYITPQTLKEKLNNNDDILIIDIRSREEFSSLLGHIEGAFNLPFHEIETKFETAKDKIEKFKDTPIVIVGFKDGMTGVKAYRFLLSKGFLQVYVLDNGITAWVRSGYPIISERK